MKRSLRSRMLIVMLAFLVTLQLYPIPTTDAGPYDPTLATSADISSISSGPDLSNIFEK